MNLDFVLDHIKPEIDIVATTIYKNRTENIYNSSVERDTQCTSYRNKQGVKPIFFKRVWFSSSVH